MIFDGPPSSPAGPIEIWSVFTVGIVFVNDHSLCVIISHLFIPCLHCYCFPLQITTKKENKITNLTRGRHLYPVLVFPIWCPQLILDVSPPLFMAPPLLLAGVLPPWILINIETRWEEDRRINISQPVNSITSRTVSDFNKMSGS